MRNVCATFYIYGPNTDISAPDREDGWGKYTLEISNAMNQASFEISDSKGKLELTVRHETSFRIRVWGNVPDDVIDSPNPQRLEHQDTIIEFYSRAFALLNSFILRYRVRTFDYKNEPLKWRAAKFLNTQDGTRTREFYLETPLREFDVDWEVDGQPSSAPEAIELKVHTQPPSKGHMIYPYDADTLELILQDVEQLLQGKDVEASVYETALELLMHAQEIVVRESRERKDERPSTVSAAIITVASACEIFVRDFVKQYGSPLHKFIIKEKETSFSVINLLDQVLPEIPAFGKPLRDFNPELAHNLYWLFKARNNSAHKGRAVISLKHEEQYWENEGEDDERRATRVRDVGCQVEGWMIYDEGFPRSMDYGDVYADWGSFVFDVLALIEWLRSTVGERWIKPSIKRYWEEQSKLPIKTREKEILERTLALRD
jgi:hypothetical protein